MPCDVSKQSSLQYRGCLGCVPSQYSPNTILPRIHAVLELTDFLVILSPFCFTYESNYLTRLAVGLYYSYFLSLLTRRNQMSSSLVPLSLLCEVRSESIVGLQDTCILMLLFSYDYVPIRLLFIAVAAILKRTEMYVYPKNKFSLDSVLILRINPHDFLDVLARTAYLTLLAHMKKLKRLHMLEAVAKVMSEDLSTLPLQRKIVDRYDRVYLV